MEKQIKIILLIAISYETYYLLYVNLLFFTDIRTKISIHHYIFFKIKYSRKKTFFLSKKTLEFFVQLCRSATNDKSLVFFFFMEHFQLRQCVTVLFTLFRVTRNSGILDDVITLVQKFDFRTNVITQKFNGIFNVNT